MTKEYETIRAIRNKMFPPVLKFGCEVEYEKDVWIIWGEEDGLVRLCNGNKTAGTWIPEHLYKILGLPVSLNYILLMIGDVERSKCIRIYDRNRNAISFPQFFIGAGGRCHGPFGMYELSISEETKLFDIDLTKSIKDQTPETLRAIIKLIED